MNKDEEEKKSNLKNEVEAQGDSGCSKKWRCEKEKEERQNQAELAVSTALRWVQGDPSHTDRVLGPDGRGRTKGDVAGVSQGGAGCDFEEEELSDTVVVPEPVVAAVVRRTGQTGRHHCTIRNEQEYTTRTTTRAAVAGRPFSETGKDLEPCTDRPTQGPQSRKPSVVEGDRKQQQDELQDEIEAPQRHRQRSSERRTYPDGS